MKDGRPLLPMLTAPDSSLSASGSVTRAIELNQTRRTSPAGGCPCVMKMPRSCSSITEHAERAVAERSWEGDRRIATSS